MAVPSAPPDTRATGESLPLPPALLHELLDALRSVRYGSVELMIHEGRVVQLERREKVRIDTEVRRRR